jgi:hypothetical protein
MYFRDFKLKTGTEDTLRQRGFKFEHLQDGFKGALLIELVKDVRKLPIVTGEAFQRFLVLCKMFAASAFKPAAKKQRSAK